MSNTAIQLRKSGVTGNTPVDLQYGEVALNYADGKLYYKTDLGSISYITNQDTFGTVNANGQLILATSPTDILKLEAGNNITIGANTTTKTITINSLADNSRANAAFDLANNIVDGLVSLANVTIATNGSITFADGTIQYNRAPISVTNQDWDDGLDINTLLPGDLWFEEIENKLYIYTNFGTYNDFFDVTPQKF
jgi:hypothetical protein